MAKTPRRARRPGPRPHTLQMAWDPRFLDWRLGPGHPTDPRRAAICREILEALDIPQVEHAVATYDEYTTLQWMAAVHGEDYLVRLRRGYSDEWTGERKDLAEVAQLMFAGTIMFAENALDRMRDAVNKPLVYWNPMGAKHHAHADSSAGFCVLNDMAATASLFTEAGKRVAYLDWDVHHGDGVEELLAPMPLALTYSIHQGGIFPGTGLSSSMATNSWNAPLEEGDGDVALAAEMADAIATIRAWKPDVILLAAGADGLAGDPLGGLEYSIPGLARAGRQVGRLASQLGVPVIAGGAGGYQPLTNTPRAWAAVVAALWAGANELASTDVRAS